ncbi:hypothetical protein MLD38_024068 [Melastoma candidum]|uniref:Uncharacterized protein n=1 Tax=Melastoma candidum TaxID=119954 RepID=A0ACB9NR79_9MYRT|nr:hypothetical protein MLD38_024068 [Melastoma candidum]
MAEAHSQTDDLEFLTRAFSGHGVDEASLISILGTSHPDQRRALRKSNPHFFKEDERLFERWDDHSFALLKLEFLRFKNAVVLWAMHPWERDARLLKEALLVGPSYSNIIIEVACTRSSEELLGARMAYHSLFEHSIEEEIAFRMKDSEGMLLVALVSAYRYDGPKYKEDVVKFEAKFLAAAIKSAEGKSLIEDEEVIKILTTRSKLHLEAVHKHYKEISGCSLDEDLISDSILRETVRCLCTPERYFSQILNESLKTDAPENMKKALTRVIVTRADVDIKEIEEEFENLYGVPLLKRIESTSKGNYRDFLLALISKGR